MPDPTCAECSDPIPELDAHAKTVYSKGEWITIYAHPDHCDGRGCDDRAAHWAERNAR